MSDTKPPAATKWHEGNRFYILDVFNDEMQEGIVGPLTKKIDELSKVKDAEHLIHYGSFDGYRKHTPLQIDRHTAHYKRWVRTIRRHYERYASVPKLEEHMKDDDFWISAAQCIKWKLADKYLDEL